MNGYLFFDAVVVTFLFRIAALLDPVNSSGYAVIALVALVWNTIQSWRDDNKFSSR